MKVAILQCDEVLTKFQSRFGQYRDMIEQMFANVSKPLQFDCFDCQQGQYPDNPSYYDFYITTGSKASVYEGAPWIDQLIQFIRLLDSKKKKLIGICFGHQAIAMAYHGTVEKSTRGWGVGIASNSVVTKPEWMSEKADTLNILVSHQDQISVLPEGALVIARNAFCPYFMVQWNDHFLSIQGHPEWKSEYSRTLMNERRGLIGSERVEQGLDSLKNKPDNQLFVRWIIAFINHTPSSST